MRTFPTSFYDYLVIGQGIAGSLLAREILQRGYSVKIVDPGQSANASTIAGGVYNPITGQRAVRTWGDTWLLPYAKNYYETFHEQTGVKVHTPLPILRIFKSEDERERLLTQAKADASYATYVQRMWAATEVPHGLHAPLGAVTLNRGGYVNISRLLSHLRTEFEAQDMMIAEHLDYADLTIHRDHLDWKGLSFRNLVFCEGYRVSNNPWFKSIPFRHAKGEILTLEIPDLPTGQIISGGILLIPAGPHRFKISGTYEWHELDEHPTETRREELLTKLRDLCPLPFTVLEHHAAVRPIASDRAPVAGRHPEHPCISLFNGFGSKGVLYAPYYSKMLIDHLEHQGSIDDKVSIETHWNPKRPMGR